MTAASRRGDPEANPSQQNPDVAVQASGSRSATHSDHPDREPMMAQVLHMQNRLFERMVANTENFGVAFA
ncbi:hypothetical protein E2562_018777 [Oryza meyeriana var. granulata]|uniref:Uncharacterized protein n=1 Tax=Oryza meyeriana var. granulata TaxID=110450 RepID=A0A6G1EX94_9ORYZ|nr:hypothetical protein E2562_018777 [Oryza meyeriana var. granulata]